MRFTPTPIDGVFVIEAEPIPDERGFFARVFCEEEFGSQGLVTRFVQHSISFSPALHTLRGLHYQAEPHAETKVVRCTRGAVFDVVVDLRVDSPTYLHHVSLGLTAGDGNAVYIPAGCAHGHLTVEEDTELLYLISDFHRSEAARGVRWNDGALGIHWPAAPRVISRRDNSYPDLEVA